VRFKNRILTLKTS